jgi:hypothetical protein
MQMALLAVLVVVGLLARCLQILASAEVLILAAAVELL